MADKIRSNTPDEIIEIVKAFKEGKPVEVRASASSDKWCLVAWPGWNFAYYQYRAKPEPEKSVGYRRYLRKIDNKACVHVIWSTGRVGIDGTIEKYGGFIRWIDTEWQYETV